ACVAVITGWLLWPTRRRICHHSESCGRPSPMKRGHFPRAVNSGIEAMAASQSSIGEVATPAGGGREERFGMLLVFLSALCWSFGGAIARFLEVEDSWTIVVWRSLWAAAFLLAYMIWRDGTRGTVSLFAKMGLPGVAVAICFASAS